MFRKAKEEYVIPIMPDYSARIHREIKQCFNGEREYKILDFDLGKCPVVSIDKVKIGRDTNGSIVWRVDKNTTGEYLKSFNKGLGKFISKDFKDKTNFEKYLAIKYKDKDSHTFVAIIRFVSNSELGDQLEDMKMYHAVTDQLEKSIITKFGDDGNPEYINKGTWYAVIKVFPVLETSSIENMLGLYTPIAKPNNLDMNWVYEEDPIDEILKKQDREKNHKVEEEPESLSEENLF